MRRPRGAWAAAAAVLLAGVFVLLGLVLWMLGVDTSYGPLAMATGAVLVAGACGALAW